MDDPSSQDRFYLGETPANGTVAAAVTARLIQHAIAHGVGAGELLERVGWPSPSPPGPDARVSFQVHWSVWQQIHQRGVEGDFGLSFGDSFELEHLGVLGMLMSHNDTVEQAIAQQTRFQRLLLDVPFTVTRLEPGKLVIEHPPLPIAMRLPHMIVAGLAFWMKLLCLLVRERVHASCVELPHAPLTSQEHYRAIFGVCPRFDSQRILLELDRSWWSAPIRTPPLGVETYLRARATSLLRQLPTRGERLDAVREYIVDELRHGRHPTLAGAAERTSTSTRTLQRKLHAAAASYDTLLDETRQRLSIEYLNDNRLTIGEVAVVLGYSEPATFYRAFKRWTGVSPGVYRARLV